MTPGELLRLAESWERGADAEEKNLRAAERDGSTLAGTMAGMDARIQTYRQCAADVRAGVDHAAVAQR